MLLKIKNKKIGQEGKETLTELSALKEKLVPTYCSATAQCFPVQAAAFGLVNDCLLARPFSLVP